MWKSLKSRYTSFKVGVFRRLSSGAEEHPSRTRRPMKERGRTPRLREEKVWPSEQDLE